MAFRNYFFVQILAVFCSIRFTSDFRLRISDYFAKLAQSEIASDNNPVSCPHTMPNGKTRI